MLYENLTSLAFFLQLILIELSEGYSELIIDLEKLFTPLGTSLYPSKEIVV